MAGDRIHFRFEACCFYSSIEFHLYLQVSICPGESKSTEPAAAKRQTSHRGFSALGFPNLMDATLFRSLVPTFLVCFVALAAIFNIFTLFELWRFIAVTQAGAGLVARYLLFLLPLITVELFPATMLITVLVTYALLARRHEAIAWWASGQSVYRLMLPGFFFALAIAFGSWLVQEYVMPGTNLKQDAIASENSGWRGARHDTQRRAVAGVDRNSTILLLRVWRRRKTHRADNLRIGFGSRSSCTSGQRKDRSVVDPTHLKITEAQTLALNGMDVERRVDAETIFAGVEPPNVFKPTIDKPSQLSSQDLHSYLNAAKHRGMDVSALSVALQKKYAGPFGIIIMALIGMPLAVSFGRKGTVLAICAAVVVGIAYWAVGGGFQQLGNHGLLRPSVAGWSPLLIFTAAGTYFLSRVRT